MQKEELSSWTELKTRIQEIRAEAKAASRKLTGLNHSELIFRGQGSDEWNIETTYDRMKPRNRLIDRYYSRVNAAIGASDSLSDSISIEIDQKEVELKFSSATLFPQPLPGYDVLVELRHHGFPSPLLDWTRSFFVASFFAFQNPQDSRGRVAIYIYQEYAGSAKVHSHDDPYLVSFGPWVRTHRRHVLQQAQYTMAVQRKNKSWMIASHEDVFASGSNTQDRLIKLTIPANQARVALEELDEMNVNAYSLFQSSDALFQTLGYRLFRDS